MHTLIFLSYAAVVGFFSLRASTSDPGIEHLDKLTHLLVYYIFAVFGYRMLQGRPHYWAVCLGIVVYGGLLELAQSSIPGRHMSGYDLVANTLGVVLGAVAVRRRRAQSTGVRDD